MFPCVTDLDNDRKMSLQIDIIKVRFFSFAGTLKDECKPSLKIPVNSKMQLHFFLDKCIVMTIIYTCGTTVVYLVKRRISALYLKACPFLKREVK